MCTFRQVKNVIKAAVIIICWHFLQINFCLHPQACIVPRCYCSAAHFNHCSWKIGCSLPIFNFNAFHIIVHVFIPETQVHLPSDHWIMASRPAVVEIADIGTLSHLAKFGGNLSWFHTFSWMIWCIISKNNSTTTCKMYCVMQTDGIYIGNI